MSTLKVAAINNPSAPSGGLAISTAGNVTGAGLDLIVSQSFTAASSVSLNNCFSSTYDNYQVVYSLSHSVSAFLQARVRASGADDTGSNYYEQYLDGTNATASAARSTAASAFQFGSSGTNRSFGQFTLIGPSLAVNTGLLGTHYMRAASLTVWGKEHMVASAYDGLTLYPNTGTITGLIRVYGYRN